MSANKASDKNKASAASAEIADHLENVFLAGLGALSTASEIGAKTFESLVDQGEKYRTKASKKTEQLIEEAQDAVREVSENAQSKASGLFDQVRETSRVDRLQGVFDGRIDDALHRLGVPTRKDVDALNAKLDQLIELVESRQTKPASKAATKKRKVARKPAAKK
jgi:poly(hydroxyalkanoate) granule-associated protein